MRRTTIAAVLSGALLMAASASADVHLTIQNGQVTLSAKDATVRQILEEWARVGQTKIVNAERVAGSQVTLELAGVSEEQALDVILRSVSGYLAAPRSVAVSNASRYDRILVLPTSTGTRASAAPAPSFQQPQFNPPRIEDSDDDQDEPGPPMPQNGAMPNGGMPNGGMPNGGMPNGGMPTGVMPNGMPMGVPPNGAAPSQRGPIFNAFPPGPSGQPMPQSPQPQDGTPQTAPQPTRPGPFSTPAGGNMAPGSAVPGMVVPAPPQPGPGAVQETP